MNDPHFDSEKVKAAQARAKEIVSGWDEEKSKLMAEREAKRQARLQAPRSAEVVWHPAAPPRTTFTPVIDEPVVQDIGPFPGDIPLESTAEATPSSQAAERPLATPYEWTDPELHVVPPLTLAQWSERSLTEPDFLMGKWLSTTSRVMLTAKTGLGKSMFCMALAFRVAAGEPFLHWAAGRPCRVLYVDGEMSTRLMARRLRDEAARLGRAPEGFLALSREDYPNMQPLNTEAGRKWMLDFIADTEAELVVFDNVMSLTVGDQSKPEVWQGVLPMVLELTRRNVAQLWVHHTGHNSERSYGDSTREWQLDTTIHLDGKRHDFTDVSFELKFPKARERMPETRSDFDNVCVTLLNDDWLHDKPTEDISKLKDNDRHMFRILQRAENGLSKADWWQAAKEEGISKTTAYRVIDDLHDQKKVKVYAGVYKAVSK